MKYKIGILTAVTALSLVFGCNPDWNKYYKTEPATVDENVWDAMQADPDLSVFVGVLKTFKYDTLFSSNNTYTIFAPDNDAMNTFLDTATMDTTILNYHFSRLMLQTSSIKGKRKLQTLGRKFALLEQSGNVTTLDGVQMDYESPLYLNGKYFKMGKVAEPKPNLYEYIAQNNPVLKRYIDEQDSVVLDKQRSRPIGFDSLGNTVYDTVATIINKFEQHYFPVKHEFRNKSATIAFPSSNVYNSALDVMATNLGGAVIDHNDIPYDWQKRVLIPSLLVKGVFENMIERQEFLKRWPSDSVKLKNIEGDSIGIDYIPTEKTICSNGYAYSYENFTVPDSLYNGSTRFEAEWLMKSTGINKYAWFSWVTVTSDQQIQPVKSFDATASRDSVINLLFPANYTGKFTLEFKTKGYSLFPRKYLMIVRTYMTIGGIYNIYVNDELVKTIDYDDYTYNNHQYYSVDGERVYSNSQYNVFDCYVNSIYQYSQAKIRIEYTGKSLYAAPGLVLDYIDFIPADKFVGYKKYKINY